jgi:hypothetical protein
MRHRSVFGRESVREYDESGEIIDQIMLSTRSKGNREVLMD